jgi:hypothetical protein
MSASTALAGASIQILGPQGSDWNARLVIRKYRVRFLIHTSRQQFFPPEVINWYQPWPGVEDMYLQFATYVANI